MFCIKSSSKSKMIVSLYKKLKEEKNIHHIAHIVLCTACGVRALYTTILHPRPRLRVWMKKVTYIIQVKNNILRNKYCLLEPRRFFNIITPTFMINRFTKCPRYKIINLVGPCVTKMWAYLKLYVETLGESFQSALFSIISNVGATRRGSRIKISQHCSYHTHKLWISNCTKTSLKLEQKSYLFTIWKCLNLYLLSIRKLKDRKCSSSLNHIHFFYSCTKLFIIRIYVLGQKKR